MNKTVEQVLQRVTEDTFENLAFVFPVDEAQPSSAAAGPAVTAAVSFSGPNTGTLFLSVPANMVSLLVTNMLGLDGEDPSGEQLTDGVKEMLNVICGNLLPAIAGKTAVFNVHPPRLITPDNIPARLDDAEPVANIALNLDAGSVQLRLFISAAALNPKFA